MIGGQEGILSLVSWIRRTKRTGEQMDSAAMMIEQVEHEEAEPTAVQAALDAVFEFCPSDGWRLMLTVHAGYCAAIASRDRRGTKLRMAVKCALLLRSTDPIPIEVLPDFSQPTLHGHPRRTIRWSQYIREMTGDPEEGDGRMITVSSTRFVTVGAGWLLSWERPADCWAALEQTSTSGAVKAIRSSIITQRRVKMGLTRLEPTEVAAAQAERFANAAGSYDSALARVTLEEWRAAANSANLPEGSAIADSGPDDDND